MAAIMLLQTHTNYSGLTNTSVGCSHVHLCGSTERRDQGPNLRLSPCLLHVSALPLMSGLAGACARRGGRCAEAQCSQSEGSVKLAFATCQSWARDPKPKQLWRGRLRSFAVLLNLNKGLELFLGHWILDL